MSESNTVMWGNHPFTVRTTIDALNRLGCNVSVEYRPGGIHISITRLGRGQAHSGIDEAEILAELLLRMITEGDLPATAEGVQHAGKEMAKHKEPESVRSVEEEGLQQGEGGSNLERASAGKETKAKKVKA